MNQIKSHNRRAAFTLLKEFCVFAMGKNSDKGYFTEVTEWTNGEGYDILVEGVDGKRTISLTCGEWEAIKKCIKAIEKID